MSNDMEILDQILDTILNTVIYEEHKSIWIYSKPMFSSIIINPEGFDRVKTNLLEKE